MRRSYLSESAGNVKTLFDGGELGDDFTPDLFFSPCTMLLLPDPAGKILCSGEHFLSVRS